MSQTQTCYIKELPVLMRATGAEENRSINSFDDKSCRFRCRQNLDLLIHKFDGHDDHIFTSGDNRKQCKQQNTLIRKKQGHTFITGLCILYNVNIPTISSKLNVFINVKHTDNQAGGTLCFTCENNSLLLLIKQ